RAAVQPPYLKPPVGSSSEPPGACMTPSRLTNAPATIFRIVLLLRGRPVRAHKQTTNELGGNRHAQEIFLGEAGPGQATVLSDRSRGTAWVGARGRASRWHGRAS